MNPTLHRPLSFSIIGRRPTNQDALWPVPGGADETTRLFVVCDGIGGSDRGEVASQLLAGAVGQYMAACNYPVLDIVHLQTALSMAYEAYAAFMQQHPMVNRMGSTLALVQLHEQGATVAHMGDSRVYWIRNGQILFRTTDHRRVTELVEAGILTAEQARHHPWRNRLSRAVMAHRTEDGFRRSATEPALTTIHDLRAGDYFFLCTDGMLEQVDDQTLAATLARHTPDSVKLQSLLACCHERTQDNYSGYLICLRTVHDGPAVLSLPSVSPTHESN